MLARLKHLARRFDPRSHPHRHQLRANLAALAPTRTSVLIVIALTLTLIDGGLVGFVVGILFHHH